MAPSRSPTTLIGDICSRTYRNAFLPRIADEKRMCERRSKLEWQSGNHGTTLSRLTTDPIMRTACRHKWQQFQGLCGLGQETTRGTLVPIIPSSALQIRPNWSLFRLYTTVSVRYQSSERKIEHFWSGMGMRMLFPSWPSCAHAIECASDPDLEPKRLSHTYPVSNQETGVPVLRIAMAFL
jgi:hypothetical protein